MRQSRQPDQANGRASIPPRFVPLGREVICDLLRIQWLPRLVFGVTMLAIVTFWQKEINLPPLNVTAMARPETARQAESAASLGDLGQPSLGTAADAMVAGLVAQSDRTFTNSMPHLASRR